MSGDFQHVSIHAIRTSTLHCNVILISRIATDALRKDGFVDYTGQTLYSVSWVRPPAGRKVTTCSPPVAGTVTATVKCFVAASYWTGKAFPSAS